MQLAEINTAGEQLRKYDGPVSLGWPRYLSLELNSGKIVLADYNKNCILLLNEKLELERELLDSATVNRPRRVCYVEEIGQLFVIDSKLLRRVDLAFTYGPATWFDETPLLPTSTTADRTSAGITEMSSTFTPSINLS